MIRAVLVRGKYLNNFEGQNYIFDDKKIKLTAISSWRPLHQKFPFPVIRLPSIADIEDLGILGRFGTWRRLIKIISNRTLGDSQILFGLEKYASKFDIFHTADPHYYYSYQLAKLRSQNKIKKLVATSWETIPFNNEGVKAKAKIKKFTMENTDMFICYTNKAKLALIKEGVNPDKIKIVRLGVDINKFSPKRIKNFKKDFVILFVGRLVKEKGIEDLKEAWLKIKKKFSNVKLKIASGLSYEKMVKVYQSADILVAPSKRTRTWEEQYGMVLVEALASGLPVIAYNSGVTSEIIGESGILVKEGNIKGLIQSIKRLVEDQDLRCKLGRISRERAERYFDSQKTAKEIEKIYRELLIADC